jgi:hypothetical protein
VPANSVVGYPDGEDGRRAPAAAWTPALAPVPVAGGAVPPRGTGAETRTGRSTGDLQNLCGPEQGVAVPDPPGRRYDGYLVDSASSHMLVLKIKPCMSKYKQLYSETANGSLNQLSFI